MRGELDGLYTLRHSNVGRGLAGSSAFLGAWKRGSVAIRHTVEERLAARG